MFSDPAMLVSPPQQAAAGPFSASVFAVARRFRRGTVVLSIVVAAAVPSAAQTTAVLQGLVRDTSGALLPNATVTVRNDATAFDVTVRTDQQGHYRIASIPPGTYMVVAEAADFRPEVIEQLRVDVGRTLVRDFRLSVGDRSETVVVTAERPLIDRATATVSHLITPEIVQEIPLNGRHFVDLGLLGPAAVAPSQAGFSSRPIRGIGTLAFNSAGNREEAVAFLVNGVTTNNLTFGSLIFEPPLASIEEFKVDNSPFAAEHGHVSGAIVNIVTRSGSDDVHGELFEFVRNDALDARNFFELTSPDPHPFKRNQFGGSGGGPLRRGQTFFFAAYEGLRQRQGIDLNSLVLSDQQRAAATDPTVRRLIALIPRANFIDAGGTARYIGSARAVVDTDRWTVDVRHRVGTDDRLQVFYGRQEVRATEPTSQGNSIPGFGQRSQPSASTLTASETHVAGGWLNEGRFGRSTLHGGTFPAASLNPADFGIRNGVTAPIGLPQMIVAGDLNFGGPGPYPQGRFDTSYVTSDTLRRAVDRHALAVGAEYRHFVNENFAQGTGVFNFPGVDAFLAGTANAFSITLGERRSVVDQHAVSAFVQDDVRFGRMLTLQLGMRYEWHVTPTERNDRFVVFDADSVSLVRVGVDVPRIYRQNNLNVEPRAGMALQLGDDGRTVLHASYARTVDEPGTTAVRDTAGNPPFAMPLTASGAVPLSMARDAAQAAGLAPSTIDPRFRNASVQSWNVNLQRQLAATLAATVGYMGARGTHLRITRNLNQPVDGVRPFPALSLTSPFMPGRALGNIMQVESSGFSRYQAMWVSAAKRLSQGLQFDASYTWSKSLDTNSLNSSGFAVQDSYDIPGQYGLSDFDARHRFVWSGTYTLPFSGHALTRGWQAAAVVQAQSGNPVNIVTSDSMLNGVPNTVRPDVAGPIRIVGSVDQWFDPAAFVAANHFGNLGRNVVVGPGFSNVDLSLTKIVRPTAKASLQMRADVFDLFNHPNFGPPGAVVGSPAFGKITRTRLPTGEAGSSRQVQLSARLSF